jgi:hypothetical protein
MDLSAVNPLIFLFDGKEKSTFWAQVALWRFSDD